MEYPVLTTVYKKALLFFKIESYGHAIVWCRQLSKRQKILAAAAVLVVLGLLMSILVKKTPDEVVAKETLRSVRMASVSSLSNREQTLPLVGIVTSISEATLRAETGGKLVYVSKKIGDHVFAGDIIAEFENSSERASLLQAEGVYEQAQAAKGIATLTSNQTGTTLLDSKTAGLNAVSSAYTTMDDAIAGKSDVAYTDPGLDRIHFILTVPDSQLVGSLLTQRKAIQILLQKRSAHSETLTTNSDVASELLVTTGELQVIKGYLDDLFVAYGKALPDGAVTEATLQSGKANVQIARLAINASIASVTLARSTLLASFTAQQIGGNTSSSVSGTLASADAQVKQALGAYRAAQSRLEKTIIRSPIPGTINSLSLHTGDYVGAFTQVAVISNNRALEIRSQVTEDDAKRITVGAHVTINQDIPGIVTQVPEAIDPTTKKIEVRVGLQDTNNRLVNGQSVRITLSKKDTSSSPSKNLTNGKEPQNTPLSIPISSLKLTPRGAYVFTRSASSTLVAISVKEGAILGDMIQIIEGLRGDEIIVVDARGLKEGMSVTVENK